MTLQNTLQLIQEVKKTHLAYGAAGLIGAAGLGAYAADAGLLGHDAQHQMAAIKSGIHGAHAGFRFNQLKYDMLTDPSKNNMIDRNLESFAGAKVGAKAAYHAVKGHYGDIDNIVPNDVRTRMPDQDAQNNILGKEIERQSLLNFNKNFQNKYNKF